jgi:hypothetical protein
MRLLLLFVAMSLMLLGTGFLLLGSIVTHS